MKVLIAGGSGFTGRHLSASLVSDGHEVVILTRRHQAPALSGVRLAQWDGRTPDAGWVTELDGADAIVNLAGASIGGRRWTARRKAELLNSRLAPTSAIVQAIERRPADRPSVLVNASGIDYYPHRRDDSAISEDGPVGTAFLARLCQQWEAAAVKAEALGVRVVRIRTSMAFGRGAPAFFLVTLPFRLFVGGRLGDGRQWFTWIHIEDLVGLYRLALENPRLSGPINAVAPDVRRQRETARQIGRVLHRPSLFPAPSPMLRLALGEQADLLLHGRRAIPSKAQAAGYSFAFGGLHEALQDVLKKR